MSAPHPPSSPSTPSTPSGAGNAAAHNTTPRAELLDDSATLLTLDALACACRMDAGWVVTRLQEGLLQTGTDHPADSPTTWRFSSATVVRARRLAHLEVTFGADPQLAALTTDLIEEVATLSQQLRHLHGR